MSRDAEKRAKRERDRTEVAIKFVMGDKRGRAFVWFVLNKTGLFANLMGNNAGQSSWLIGRRDVGVEIMRDLRDEFDFLAAWRLMEDEAREQMRLDQPQPAARESEPDED